MTEQIVSRDGGASRPRFQRTRGLRRLAAVLVALAIGAGQAAGQAPEAGIDHLVSELKNPSARARITALQGLASAARPESAATIAGALADPDDSVQQAAIDALLADLHRARRSQRPAVGSGIERQNGDPAGSGFRSRPARDDAGARSA